MIKPSISQRSRGMGIQQSEADDIVLFSCCREERACIVVYYPYGRGRIGLLGMKFAPNGNDRWVNLDCSDSSNIVA
jgi:hypothetical protein